MCRACGGAMVEDLTFRAEMLAYNLPQRRFGCAACGRARITAIPPPVTGQIREATQAPKQCQRCGKAFTTRYNNAKYCGDFCRRDPARDRARQVARVRPKGSVRSWGAALALHPTGPRRVLPDAETRRVSRKGWA